MKYIKLIAAVSSVSAIANAGEPAPVQPAPAPAPSLGEWFVGAGFGQFETENNAESVYPRSQVEDFSYEMYTLHVGRDLGTQFLGCDLAAYLEVGFMDGEANARFGNTALSVDSEIIPITLNLLAERTLFAGIKGYISAGIGYAFTDFSTSQFNLSEEDGGFYAQASIGLAYDINEQWEIYGGARWIYLGDLDFGVSGLDVDDTVGYEIGLRYSF